MTLESSGTLERAYFQKNRMSEARAAMDGEYQGREGFESDLCRASAISGPAARVSAFRKLIGQPTAGVRPFLVARQLARIQQTDLALDWLERAFAVRDPDLASIRVEPALDSLHNDPRYQDLLKKVGLSE